MKVQAIVYESKAGHTKQYAQMLSAALGIPAYPRAEAAKAAGVGVLFMGWICAGQLSGYGKVKATLDTRAVCGVGMGASGADQMSAIRTACGLKDAPAFYLQGGLEMDKLRGVPRLMMKIVGGSMRKKLEAKQGKTAEDQDMLDMFLHGGNRVNAANLAPVIQWAKGEK